MNVFNLIFHKPEPGIVADPALVDRCCAQAVEIELLKQQIADLRRRPRATDGSGRFVSRVQAKADKLRSELQGQANQPLQALLEANRS